MYLARLEGGRADAAMLAYWQRHADRIAAVLTSNADLLSYGVARLAMVETLTLGDGEVDAEVWDGDRCRTMLGCKNQLDMHLTAALYKADESLSVRGAVERQWRKKGGLAAACKAMLEHVRGSKAGRPDSQFLTRELKFTGKAAENMLADVDAREAFGATVERVSAKTVDDRAAYKAMFWMVKPLRDPFCPAYIHHMFAAGITVEHGGPREAWHHVANVARRRRCLQPVLERGGRDTLSEISATSKKVLQEHTAAAPAPEEAGEPPRFKERTWEVQVCEAFHRLLELWASGGADDDKLEILESVAPAFGKEGVDLLKRLRKHEGSAYELSEEMTEVGKVTKEEWDELDGRGRHQAAKQASRAIRQRMITGKKLLNGEFEPNQTQNFMIKHAKHFAKYVAGEKEEPPILGLATPPGSGKTCGAVLLHKILNDMGYVLVYSVPTKQVLIRVGQECEVAGVVYWVATRASAGQFEVRRPYSVRTLRTKGAGGLSGSMTSQLELASFHAKEHKDRLAKGIPIGNPGMIVCDIDSVGELLMQSQSINGGKVCLFIDEPNFAFGWPGVKERMRALLKLCPDFTVLASATLTAAEAEWLLPPERPLKLESGVGGGTKEFAVAVSYIDDDGETKKEVPVGVAAPNKYTEPAEHNGIELVLCAHPAQRALRYATQERQSEVRKLHAETTKALEKYNKRLARMKTEPGQDDETPPKSFQAGKATLYVDSVDALGYNTCGMLSAGVAYIDSRETGENARALRLHLAPLLLRPPARSAGATPVRRLYVDYSCVYGLDCKALTRVSTFPDAEGLLTDGDLVQLAGRLRNGGTVCMAKRGTAERLLQLLKTA